MGGQGEYFEPLFDYRRVQRSNLVCIDDDDSDDSEIPIPKRSKTCPNTVVKEDVIVIEVAGRGGDDDDDDWLPPPPKVIFDNNKESGADSTIKALRLKKMELISYTKTIEDVMNEVEESAKRQVQESLKLSSEDATQGPPGPNDRAKIVITIQGKDEQNKFRVYADEKFERVLKMYTDKVKLDPQGLVFVFDGDKIDPSTTPCNLGMEDDDIIEVHTKKR
ncbi:unnamed protein product [Cochlearia groenlandica]